MSFPTDELVNGDGLSFRITSCCVDAFGLFLVVGSRGLFPEINCPIFLPGENSFNWMRKMFILFYTPIPGWTCSQ